MVAEYVFLDHATKPISPLKLGIVDSKNMFTTSPAVHYQRVVEKALVPTSVMVWMISGHHASYISNQDSNLAGVVYLHLHPHHGEIQALITHLLHEQELGV